MPSSLLTKALAWVLLATSLSLAGWFGSADGASDASHVGATVNESFKALFAEEPRCTLDLESDVGGYVSVYPPSDEVTRDDRRIFQCGVEVQLDASPYGIYRFIGWRGDTTGTNRRMILTMTSNKSITAGFSSSAGTTARSLRRDGAWIEAGRLFVNFDLPGRVHLDLVSVEGRTIAHLGSSLRTGGTLIDLPRLPARPLYLRVRGPGIVRVVPLSVMGR